MKNKKREIKKLVKEMLKESHAAMVKKIDTVLASDAVDLQNWDWEDAPMVLPKTIVTALLEYEASQYSGEGTCFEKGVEKDVARIKQGILYGGWR